MCKSWGSNVCFCFSPHYYLELLFDVLLKRPGKPSSGFMFHSLRLIEWSQWRTGFWSYFHVGWLLPWIVVIRLILCMQILYSVRSVSIEETAIFIKVFSPNQSDWLVSCFCSMKTKTTDLEFRICNMCVCVWFKSNCRMVRYSFVSSILINKPIQPFWILNIVLFCVGTKFELRFWFMRIE